MKAMSSKKPQTIFTDQCAAMAKAIMMVFPSSSHRLCLWHIYQNTGKHLSHVIANNPDFLKDFKKCVYKEKSVEHFNIRWQELIDTYNLHENDWIQNMYTLRENGPQYLDMIHFVLT
jgi:zinc finger SWIM domain-containing protein 3